MVNPALIKISYTQLYPGAPRRLPPRPGNRLSPAPMSYVLDERGQVYAVTFPWTGTAELVKADFALMRDIQHFQHTKYPYLEEPNEYPRQNQARGFAQGLDGRFRTFSHCESDCGGDSSISSEKMIFAHKERYSICLDKDGLYYNDEAGEIGLRLHWDEDLLPPMEEVIFHSFLQSAVNERFKLRLKSFSVDGLFIFKNGEVRIVNWMNDDVMSPDHPTGYKVTNIADLKPPVNVAGSLQDKLTVTDANGEVLLVGEQYFIQRGLNTHFYQSGVSLHMPRDIDAVIHCKGSRSHNIEGEEIKCVDPLAVRFEGGNTTISVSHIEKVRLIGHHHLVTDKAGHQFILNLRELEAKSANYQSCSELPGQVCLAVPADIRLIGLRLDDEQIKTAIALYKQGPKPIGCALKRRHDF